MSTFFHGWRRKAGIAATLMAFILALGWIRSQFATDIIRVTTSEHKTNGIMSDNGQIAWSAFHHPTLVFPFPDFPAWVADDRLHSTTLRDLMETELMKWSWRFQSFGSGKVINPDGSAFSLLVVPYWFVTLPMALTAYLLLSESKKRGQLTSTEQPQKELSN